MQEHSDASALLFYSEYNFSGSNDHKDEEVCAPQGEDNREFDHDGNDSKLDNRLQGTSNCSGNEEKVQKFGIAKLKGCKTSGFQEISRNVVVNKNDMFQSARKIQLFMCKDCSKAFRSEYLNIIHEDTCSGHGHKGRTFGRAMLLALDVVYNKTFKIDSIYSADSKNP